MIGRLLRAWIAHTVGPECVYPAAALASIEACLAEERS